MLDDLEGHFNFRRVWRETLQESKDVPMVWELIDPQLRYTPKVRGTTLSLGNGSKAIRLCSLT